MRKKYLIVSLLVVVLVAFTIAATTWDQTFARFTNIWVGETNDTPGNTLVTNSVYIKGDVEFDGTFYPPTGGVSSTHIADITRSIPLQLVAAALDSAGTVTVIGNDGTTAPGIAAVDGIPALVYANSTEVASLGWTFTIPADFSSSLSFRMMVSSDSDASYSSLGISWAVFVNNPSVAFDATAYAQTAVLNTVATPSASNVVLTFTPSASVVADVAAGDVVTVWFGNGDGRSGAAKTTEIKMAEARYTAVQ